MHTPGPWHSWAHYWAYTEKGEAHPVNNDADARLIAAAPDLLAAMKEMVREVSFLHTKHSCKGEFSNCLLVARAEAVIAKAEGRK